MHTDLITSSSFRYTSLTRLQPITTPNDSSNLRLFTALIAAKRHSVNSELLMRSDLEEVFAQYEAEINNAFKESLDTNARITAGASAISRQNVLKENGLIPKWICGARCAVQSLNSYKRENHGIKKSALSVLILYLAGPWAGSCSFISGHEQNR